MEPGFTERVGQALLSPGAAARRLCDGGRGGLRDALCLLGLRLLATEGIVIVRGLWRLRDDGLAALFSTVTRLVQSALPDVALCGVATVALAVLIGAEERHLRPGLVLDLSAQAWIGWLAVHVFCSLGLTLVGYQPGPRGVMGVQGVALGAFALFWGYALPVARRAAVRAKQDPPASQAATEPGE